MPRIPYKSIFSETKWDESKLKAYFAKIRLDLISNYVDIDAAAFDIAENIMRNNPDLVDYFKHKKHIKDEFILQAIADYL